MIVPDASVILELLLRTPAANGIESRLFDGADTLHAPALIDVEVAQVLRRYESRGEISAQRGRLAIELLGAFPIERYPDRDLLPRIWDLRRNLTAYDAAYIALAEALDATFLTRDARIAKAPGPRVSVELI